MTTPPSTPRDDQTSVLDEYLDRLLSAEQRAAIEQRCAAEPSLAAEVKCQREIDESLSRYAQAPDARSILAEAQRRRQQSVPPTVGSDDAAAVAASPVRRIESAWPNRFTWRRLAVAAVLVLGLFGSWQIYRFLTGGPDGRYDTGPQRTLAQAYQHTLDEGFTAVWECEDDREFALVFYDQFGDMLSMNPPLPEGIEALGLKYYNVISPRTISMLVRVDGEPVMIFVDRLERDHDTDRSVPQGLNLFRRELGSLILYELTPRDEPGLVDHLRRPETLPEPGDSQSPGR